MTKITTAQIQAMVAQTHEILECTQDGGVLRLYIGVLGTPRKYYVAIKSHPPHSREVIDRAIHHIRSNAK